jgi:hypothetical protein
VTFRPGNILGSAARQQKLDEDKVRWIKRIIKLERWMRRRTDDRRTHRVPNGMYQRIADRVGVSANQIKKIANGQRWRRVKANIHTERRNKR